MFINLTITTSLKTKKDTKKLRKETIKYGTFLGCCFASDSNIDLEGVGCLWNFGDAASAVPIPALGGLCTGEESFLTPPPFHVW